MAPRDPATIQRDQNGHFAATDSQALAAGLAQQHIVEQADKAAKKAAKASTPSKQDKAVLKTIASGKDHLGDMFNSTEQVQAAAESLIQRGLLAHDGNSYSLTEAGKAAVTPKPRKKTATR